MRHALAIIPCALLALSCASTPGTEITIQALGEPGAIVSYGDQRVTLDATGHGTLWTPELHVVLEGAGVGPLENRLVDADGRGVVLHVAHAGRAVDLPPICVPVYVDTGPTQRVNLLLRRVLSDRTCRIVNPSVVVRGMEIIGSYDPTQFDDEPCGPFVPLE